jgi:putative nucleotidyltransferase with HDIG domain
MWFRKASPRRQAIREDAAEAKSLAPPLPQHTGHTVLITAVFMLVAVAIQFLPGEPLPAHVGERASTDLRSPVTFTIADPAQTEMLRQARREMAPAVLVGDAGAFDRIYGQLNDLKYDVNNARTLDEVPAAVKERFPALTNDSLRLLQMVNANAYETQLRTLVYRVLPYVPFVKTEDFPLVAERRSDRVALTLSPKLSEYMAERPAQEVIALGTSNPSQEKELRKIVGENLPEGLTNTIVSYFSRLDTATYHYDPALTAELAERSAAAMKPFGRTIQENQVIVARGETITPEQLATLREAQKKLDAEVAAGNRFAPWLGAMGRAMMVLILTVACALYIVRMSHVARTVRRGWAVCVLLLAGLLVARCAVVYVPWWAVYPTAIAPTLLTAIILVTAYNQRFALGVVAIHGLLVTITLRQNIDFYLPLLSGAAVFCFALKEIRTRGRLIEIGFVSSVASFITIWALGFSRMVGDIWTPWIIPTDPRAIGMQSLSAALAGVGVATFALAILPSIERIFQITTAMTLLELCDANKPLLRRLQQEASGTFNHSLTVGIMAEAAGNAIGANGLLCRVGAYYHDVGKLSKPLYFIENQGNGVPNRHDKLSPAMSLLIIVGHVKDGIELAREYALPFVVHQFIGQHHGTTLVEYFFHAAKKKQERQGDDAPEISETEFRYPGPKPQSREAAIVMICDACESVVRSIDEPTPGRIESAVHNMIMKRLMDGQFAECSLTLRDLSIIEDSLIRTLAGIHHGRVAYPASKPIALSQPA